MKEFKRFDFFQGRSSSITGPSRNRNASPSKPTWNPAISNPT